MGTNQEKLLNKIQDIQSDLLSTGTDYWQRYTSFDTWQFWLNLAFLILPLIAVYIFVDKNRALLLGFYGFNVHVWFTYVDTFGIVNNYWIYPYKLLPFFGTSFALDVSLIPVLFIFVYQWTLNHKKNYYIFILLLCAFLAFIFKPILPILNLFELNKGFTFFHIFLGYIFIALFSKIITNIFVYFERKELKRD